MSENELVCTSPTILACSCTRDFFLDILGYIFCFEQASVSATAVAPTTTSAVTTQQPPASSESAGLIPVLAAAVSAALVVLLVAGYLLVKRYRLTGPKPSAGSAVPVPRHVHAKVCR